MATVSNIHYTLEGKGFPVVLLHGFLEDLTMWDEFSEKLKPYYKVIRMDFLGHGKTLSEDFIYTMENQAEAVKKVLDHEKISKAIFVGHSMGGYVTLAFAERYPEHVHGFSLFFSSASADSPEKKQRRIEAAKLVKTNRESFIRAAIPTLFYQENKNLEEKKQLQFYIEKTKKMALAVTVKNVIASLEGMRLRKDRTMVLQSTIPKQLISGRFDTALDYKLLQEQIHLAKNLDYTLLNTGHMGHYEVPNETFFTLKTFIERIYN